MNLPKLCAIINLNPEMSRLVLDCHRLIDFAPLSQHISGLHHRDTWDDAFKCLANALGDDPDGIRMLAVLLGCVLMTYEFYQNKGISESIFAETMEFFSRFVDFDTLVHGRPAFHWGWWAPRQISACEFRIGALEYEMIDSSIEKVISLHIPAATDLSLPSLRQSYLDARQFFSKYFPEYANVKMRCNSWMLSPSLNKLLLSNSRLLGFQQSFVVDKIEEESTGFMKWVYGRDDIPTEMLPENTNLQRNIKNHLRSGGRIGWAYGILIDDPFLT